MSNHTPSRHIGNPIVPASGFKLLGEPRLIIGLNGQRTISGARSIFTGGSNLKFITLGLNFPGPPTVDTLVEAYEADSDFSLQQMISDSPAAREASCLTQDQIAYACDKHSDLLGRTRRQFTFFFTKRNWSRPVDAKDNYFAVYVITDKPGPYASLYALNNGMGKNGLWKKEQKHRLLVPAAIVKES